MSRQRSIISGGQGGLGRALARRLCGDGMDVLAPGRTELDVSRPDSVSHYFAAQGGVDLLVCNAGVTRDGPLRRMPEADWDQVAKVNLRGAFLCAREASKWMVKQRAGHVIFISSYSALHPPVGQANYAAAKAALLGLMRSMAKELGPRNIRVNAVLPGFLETPMTEELPESVKTASLGRHSLGRLNTPEAVAGFISFLHREMPHTSGQEFNLDSRVL